MWFDVGIKRYTTLIPYISMYSTLWFDVGIKRYTTFFAEMPIGYWLWFDVGIKRYTTSPEISVTQQSCGLM